MTISSNSRKAGPFIGNGTAATFPFTFKVFQASDLEVVKLTVSTGHESILVLNADYTASVNEDQNSSPGGSITLTSGPLPTDHNLIITSAIENLQPTDLTNQGGFYPEVITDALDRATIQIQQLQEGLDRAAVLPITSTISTDELIADILIIANNLDSVEIVSDNIAAIDLVSQNIPAINAAPGAAAAAAQSALDAEAAQLAAEAAEVVSTASANSASASAVSAEEAAMAAEAAVASANLPTSLVGKAKQFLQVKTTEDGYDLVKSVAAPVFYGFNLSVDKQSLNYDATRSEVDTANYATWTMMENVKFVVKNNQLAMVLL